MTDTAAQSPAAPGIVRLVVGGNEVSIKKLTYRPNQVWKRELEDHIRSLIPGLSALDNAEKTNLANTEELETVIHNAILLVDGAIEAALTLICAYAPDTIRRESLEAVIYDEEIIDNFLTLVQTSIPFTQLGRLITSMSRGPRL